MLTKVDGLPLNGDGKLCSHDLDGERYLAEEMALKRVGDKIDV